MKTFLLPILSLCLLCVSTQLSAFANTYPLPTEEGKPLLVRVSSPSGHEVHIRLANLMESPTSVILKDEDGETYFSKRIRKHNGYLLSLDMTDVPVGRYILHTTQDEREVLVVLYRQDESILVSQGVRQ